MPGAPRAPCHLPQLAGPPPSAQGPHPPGLTRRNGARGSAAPHLRAIERPAAPARCARCAGAAARGPAEPRSLSAWSRRPRAPEPRGVHGEWGRAPAPFEACPPVLCLRLRRVRPCACVTFICPTMKPAWAGLRLPPPSALCVCAAIGFSNFPAGLGFHGCRERRQEGTSDVSAFLPPKWDCILFPDSGQSRPGLPSWGGSCMDLSLHPVCSGSE